MGQAGKERRQAAIRARKVATKARLAEPALPPIVPVALPWRRRAVLPKFVRRELRQGEGAWSTVMTGNAEDLAGSLEAAAAMVLSLGPLLSRRQS